MERRLWHLIPELRQSLHQCPEASGRETNTRRLLMDFLREHTSLELHELGSGFYAAHREDGAGASVALRADLDAVPTPEGPRHLCGHDGHAAALCGVALALEGVHNGKNVFLLFQPAEETGEGAKVCLPILEREHIDAIYGCHNLPGFPMGQVFTTEKTFACASMGLIIRLHGTATHAAYPELGRNPAPVLGELLQALPGLAGAERYASMTLCTVIGARLGEKAFGSAASEGELWLTLRSETDEDLEKLRMSVLERARALAAEHGIQMDTEELDRFPTTKNDAACARHVMKSCGGQLLPEPMRWSEDFGHYLQRVPGAFFGIGAGEGQPGLHTADYEYPDELLAPACDAFLRLIEKEEEERA